MKRDSFCLTVLEVGKPRSMEPASACPGLLRALLFITTWKTSGREK
jgi:hypothetical protein